MQSICCFTADALLLVTILPIQVITIDDDGFHLQVTVKVNGMDTNFLLDTGASRTVFDKSRAERFAPGIITVSNTELRSTGLGTNSMEIFNGLIESISLGQIHVQEVNAAFLDLSHVNDSYSQLGISEIDGVLGNDLLFRYNAKIDLRKKELCLEDTSLHNDKPADSSAIQGT